MKKEDREALIAALAVMMAKGGKDMDLAIYAFEQLQSNRWDLRYCSPAVKNVIKKAF